MNRPLYLIIALIFSSLQISAQSLEAPRLVCANNNVAGDVILNWTIPNNPCGPFVGYDIYASMTEAGPYALLTTIGAELTTTWTHVGANGIIDTWYYYVVPDYNCPGFAQPTSDTLDNRDPEAPVIDYVTVVPGGAEINWLPSTSPEAWAYIIYRQSPGFTPIDTVYGRFSTTYTDLGAAITSQIESYSLATLDSCTSLGLFSLPVHNTILLNGSLDPCGDLSLSWNAYGEWPLGIEEHQLWSSVNGAAATLAATVSGSTFNQVLPVNDGDSVCVTVRAVRADGVFSESNPICLRIEKVQPSAYLFLRNASMLPGDSALVEWYYDPAAAIEDSEVASSGDGVLFVLKDVSPFPVAPPPFLSFTDPNATAGDFYRVTHVDSCAAEFESLPARTMRLSGDAGFSLSNSLSWNAFEIDGGTVTGYELFVNDGSGFVSLTTTTPAVTEYEHDVSMLSGNVLCYYVVATFNLDLPSIGVNEVLQSFSNEECVSQSGKIFVPNALVPGGTNNFFKPVILFGQEGTYEMNIFARNGALVFSSNDPDQGWDGRFQGELVAGGAFGYTIRFTDVNGRDIFKKGSVLVVR